MTTCLTRDTTSSGERTWNDYVVVEHDEVFVWRLVVAVWDYGA